MRAVCCRPHHRHREFSSGIRSIDFIALLFPQIPRFSLFSLFWCTVFSLCHHTFQMIRRNSYDSIGEARKETSSDLGFICHRPPGQSKLQEVVFVSRSPPHKKSLSPPPPPCVPHHRSITTQHHTHHSLTTDIEPIQTSEPASRIRMGFSIIIPPSHKNHSFTIKQ